MNHLPVQLEVKEKSEHHFMKLLDPIVGSEMLVFGTIPWSEDTLGMPDKEKANCWVQKMTHEMSDGKSVATYTVIVQHQDQKISYQFTPEGRFCDDPSFVETLKNPGKKAKNYDLLEKSLPAFQRKEALRSSDERIQTIKLALGNKQKITFPLTHFHKAYTCEIEQFPLYYYPAPENVAFIINLKEGKTAVKFEVHSNGFIPLGPRVSEILSLVAESLKPTEDKRVQEKRIEVEGQIETLLQA